MQPQFLEHYLSLLGVQRRKPGVDALGELVRAHLERIPFENISKLYYQKHLGLRGLPGLERFLDGSNAFISAARAMPTITTSTNCWPTWVIRSGYVPRTCQTLMFTW